ncbi:zinc knuckle CX2CX4HX4C containing protein [Tanacetum coccineum]
MEQGYLNRSSKATKKNGGDTSKTGSLLSGLAKKVKNINGKILDATGGCIAVMDVVHTDDNATKRVISLFVTKDNAHATVGNANAGEESIPTVNVGIENGGGASPNAACNGQNEDTCGPDNNPFVSMLKDINPLHTVHLTEIKNDVEIVGADVAIPQADVDMISARFFNTLYGYVIGKRLAFPVVENYVKHASAKYGLKRVMLHQGFFMFQFSSKEGMDSVMKNGPWRIRSIPLLLNVWNANSKQKKEDIKRVPVWVKMFNVPIVAYSEIGLSLITSKLGRPIMLDAHTSSMCLNLWGLSSFARVLVEISADNDFVEFPCSGLSICEKGVLNERGRRVKPTKNGNDGFVHVKRKKKGTNQAAKAKHIEVKPKDSLLKTNEASTSTKLVIKDDMVNDKGTIWERFKEVKKASTSDMKDESDEDEVYMPDDDMSKYISSTGGGFTMEDDDLDCYDGYEAQIYDLPEQMQAFCDHYDIRLNSHVKK